MVPDSLFNDDDDSILPRDVIIKKFQQWWTAEQIEEMLKDHLISSKAFLENIKHQESDEFRLDHLQYATILYEQVGEKFLFITEKRKRYRFLPKVLKAVAIEQPSNEKEINRMFVKYWPHIRDIPPYSDEVRLEEFLHTLRSVTSKKTFLKELVEIINLPTVCAQRAEKGIDRKTETVDPIGVLNPLYDFQNDVSYKINDMLVNYDDDTSRAIIALPTGCGKTRLVVESILDWINDGKPGQQNKKFILWIVDKKELCDQAYDAFKAVFTAMGKQDTSLKLHVFYGSKTKNLTDTLEESLSESQSYTTSVIIASIGSLHSICRSQRNLSEEDSSLRDLGKHTALVVIDEAHHAIAESYSEVLTGMVDRNKNKNNTGLGFNFRKNETHPAHTRLLGLTATPFRRENDDSFNAESERLRGRFNHNFLWPSLESSTLADEDNNPHAVMELQQSATVGMPVKITAQRSFDQDGQIREFYWQINEINASAKNHRLYNDNPDYSDNQEGHTEKDTGVSKYDTGKKHGQEGTLTENFKNWVNGDYHSDEKEVVLHVKDDVFDKAGLYEVYLWVKDDDGLICLEPDYRVIRINEKIKSSSVRDQSSLKQIYQKLMKAKVLAKPTRWILEHDSQKYLDKIGFDVTYKKQFGKDSNEYSQETLETIAEETRLNEKILAVIKKLVKEKNKKSILLFANTVDHARLLSTLIRAVLHYNSEYVYASTHIDERCKFIRQFRAKKITVLCNYDILTTGFDAPQVDAIINTRLTGSYVLYTQMIGRGLRGPKNGGTEECIIVDFNPKLRKRIANMSEDQRLEAWKFHDELYTESKTLTDADLGIEDKEALGLAIAEIENTKRDWEDEERLSFISSSEIRVLHNIFIENPELAQKPEYLEFWKYIKTRNEKLEKKEEDELRKFNETLVVEESEPSGDKLSFDVLMHFINHTMKPQANYQPAMILFLLNHPNKSATRREIAEQLELVNIKPDTVDYEKVSVYGVLEGHNIVMLEDGRSLSEDLFTLNVEDLDEEQTLTVTTELQKKIKLMEDRSEASRKANETRGPEGRKNAALKAASTKANLGKDEYDIECSDCHLKIHLHRPMTQEEREEVDEKFGFHKNDGIHSIPKSQCKQCRYENERQFRKERKESQEIFEHTCPKCNEISVKYHKPPTEEENELIEKSFGWRGDIIQSWCRLCRSPKIENKKPGFFSRFQKKRVEKN